MLTKPDVEGRRTARGHAVPRNRYRLQQLARSPKISMRLVRVMSFYVLEYKSSQEGTSCTACNEEGATAWQKVFAA